ncbi:serine O-acetyltransferase [Castellaniella sp.]|uniref:serine O-acetyltransferase n=1 Tax=Castellaniella sp. TaxID=1955812 RepID=UPI002B0002D8|nr:serine O-acetyltransferase [Castellaniella sp.]
MFEQLREEIACIHERDPAARSRIEILTCYPGLHAILIHRMAHGLWRRGWYWAGRFVSHLGRMLTGIEIHPGALIGRRVFIDHGFGVVIGETAEIGNDCTIYQGVTLGGTRLYKGEKRHPTLEEGVVVGAGAQILGGFTVGAHARIGSNAVVIKPVPAGATAVGNPARIILPQDHTSEAPASDAATSGASAAAAVQDGAPQAPSAPPTRDDLPCQSDWAAKPLQDLLQRGRQGEDAGAADRPEDFAPYGVGRSDDDPLVKVLHELINHTAQQDQRIHRLCQAMEDLGQRVENGQRPLDVERLNRMVD